MSRTPLGIGIVGCGNMGAIHARAFAATRGCRVVGYTNRTRGKAEALADQFGGEVYDDLHGMLGDKRVGAVVLATDQKLHAEQAVAAADAGRHILCEKPLALTPKQMDTTAAAVERNGVTLGVAHQMRHHPVIEQVRRAMPKLGRCFHLSLEWGFRIRGHEGRCWQTLEAGGFFMELGVHAADLAQHLMGPIEHIQAGTLKIDPKRATEDCTHCLLSFESHAIGSLLVTANHRQKRQGMLAGRVLGERGRIEFTSYPYSRAHNRATLILDGGESIFVPDLTRHELPRITEASRHKTYPGFFGAYERQAAAFVKSVKTGTPPTATLAEGRRAVEVVLESYGRQGELTKRKSGITKARKIDAACHPLLSTK